MEKAFLYHCVIKTIRGRISVIAAAMLIVTGIGGCKKQETLFAAGMQQTTSSAAAIASSISKQQALDRLNEHFENEFSSITMEQVNGVNRTQFNQWLRNSKMAAAESLYLGPLLSSDSNEYVILKNITVKETGKLATVGLIATTAPFYSQYTRMVAVIDYTKIFVGTKKICSWKKCDSYEPCPCILWIDFVTGDCPSDKCITNYDCRGYDASDCEGELTDITTFEVLGAF